MSRVGKKIITLPTNVKVSLQEGTLMVEGPKGKLHSPVPEGISAHLEGNVLSFTRVNDVGPIRAKHGLARALANNCVLGVTQGFQRQLEIIGVGYRANVAGKELELHLGYSHPIKFPLPSGITASAEQDKTTKNLIVTLQGIDKHLIGQVAANIRSLRPPEPYKGKGVRYLGEKILRKAGKSGK